MLWNDLNRNLKLAEIEPLTVTCLSREEGFQAPRSPKTPSCNVFHHYQHKDILLAGHLLKSEGDERIYIDITCGAINQKGEGF